MELIGVLGDETSHEKVFSNRGMIIGEFHVAIKKQIINTWNKKGNEDGGRSGKGK